MFIREYMTLLEDFFRFCEIRNLKPEQYDKEVIENFLKSSIVVKGENDKYKKALLLYYDKVGNLDIRDDFDIEID